MSKDDHRLEVEEDRSFSVDGIKFFIDMAPINRRPSDSEAFTIAKGEGYLRFYESLAKTVRPKSMLELGIFEGGSYVFLDRLFNPDRMSAVDIREKPVAALVEYLKGRTNRRAHFATSQSDEAVLKRIVREDLEGELDFVVDDASHAYEHTKRSFEILFPMLSPGGIYIIEDWAWAHHHAYQTADGPFGRRPSLTKLLLEQIALLGSTRDIGEIRVRKNLYMILKSQAARVGHDDVWSGTLWRGRTLPDI